MRRDARPGLEGGAVISFQELVSQAADLDEAAFVAAHPAPGLILEPFAATSDDLGETGVYFAPGFEQKKVTRRLARPARGLDLAPPIRRTSEQFVHPDATVAWVAPAGGRRGATRLTLGRAPSNDVVVPNAHVSRVQAVLHPQGDGWLIEDPESRNGTRCDGELLPTNSRSPLRDGAALTLGEAVLAKFFTAASLYRFCKLVRSMQENRRG